MTTVHTPPPYPPIKSSHSGGRSTIASNHSGGEVPNARIQKLSVMSAGIWETSFVSSLYSFVRCRKGVADNKDLLSTNRTTSFQIGWNNSALLLIALQEWTLVEVLVELKYSYAMGNHRVGVTVQTQRHIFTLQFSVKNIMCKPPEFYHKAKGWQTPTQIC